MQIRAIVTHNGEHSPEKMALACAQRLVEIDPTLTDGERVLAAQRLELAVVEALIPHHAAARDEVRGKLAADAAAHFAEPNLHDPGARLDEALAAVTEAAAGTPWEADFRDPAAQARMRRIIGQFLVDMAHLERLYHADRNPADAAAQAYRAQPTGIAVVEA